MAETHEGGCQCGTVRYKVIGKPRSVIVCHCANCRRATGSAFSFTAAFPKERVEFDDGLVGTYDFHPPDHGRSILGKFCPKCGTRFVVRLERVPNDWFVFAGTMDDPSWLKVAAQTYTRAAVDWMTFPPDVPCFAENVWDEQNKPLTPLPACNRPRIKSELFPVDGAE